MEFETVDFNWFASPHTEKNLQFAEALENRVANLYRDSWIHKYYKWNVKSENGIVMFFDRARNYPTESERIAVYLFIPEATRPYFFSKSEYKNFAVDKNIAISLISNIPYGFKSKCFPASKSLFYTAPFFIKLKTPLKTMSNYLLFKDAFKPNFEDSILAMISYNEDSDSFVAEFSPQLKFTISQNFNFTNSLEFYLVDANNQHMQVEDNSQLFFTLTVLDGNAKV